MCNLFLTRILFIYLIKKLRFKWALFKYLFKLRAKDKPQNLRSHVLIAFLNFVNKPIERCTLYISSNVILSLPCRVNIVCTIFVPYV